MSAVSGKKGSSINKNDDQLSDTKTTKRPNSCPICDVTIGKSDKALNCDICKQWICFGCSGLSPTLYKALEKEKNFSWACKDCIKIQPLLSAQQKVINALQGELDSMKQHFEHRIQVLESDLMKLQMETDNNKAVLASQTEHGSTLEKDVKGKIINLEKKMESSRKEVKEDERVKNKLCTDLKKCTEAVGVVERRLTGLEKKINHVGVTDEQETSLADIVRRNTDQISVLKIGEKNVSPSKIAEEVIDIISEGEQRKNNLIIYKLEEPKTNLKNERFKQDVEEVTKICQEVLGQNVQKEDIKRCFRLGKKEENKCRPLLITVRNAEIKHQVFSQLRKLKGSAFAHLGVEHDLTKEEREEKKALLIEARQKQQESGTRWLVRRTNGKFCLTESRNKPESN